VKNIRNLLYPLSLLHGALVHLRNLLFDVGIIPSTQFDFPVISVGNLPTGGTGKTPHVEYLIRLLKDNYKLAMLSRGYKRTTSEFVIADGNSTAKQIGDEPKQIKNKFSEIVVAVAHSRVSGINKLKIKFPELKIILLDDAFQHRYVKPNISILLTAYNNLFTDDEMLPSGNLREFPSGAARADIIIITKCPTNISPLEKKFILNKINPLPHQKIYFSIIKYGELIPLLNHQSVGNLQGFKNLEGLTSILLLTGIADAIPIKNYLTEKTKELFHLSFPDHHNFSVLDIETVKKKFDNIAAENKIIITTEKDAMRLISPEFTSVLESIKSSIYYLPIEIDFVSEEEQSNFNNQILSYVR